MKTYPVDCKHCGATHKAERDEDGASIETSRCQGGYSCQVRMCQSCLTHCKLCGLPCCAEHLAPSPDQDCGGELWCELCRAGDEEFEATMKSLLASQQDAVLVVGMACQSVEDALNMDMLLAAGCTMAESRAAIRGGVN